MMCDKNEMRERERNNAQIEKKTRKNNKDEGKKARIPVAGKEKSHGIRVH